MCAEYAEAQTRMIRFPDIVADPGPEIMVRLEPEIATRILQAKVAAQKQYLGMVMKIQTDYFAKIEEVIGGKNVFGG